jgi:hypothetical protein
MASPTTNKGYTYPAHGGAVGSWDTNLNGNFEYQDLNLGGYYQIVASSTTAAVTLGATNATIPSTARSITISASIAQNLFYNLTGTLTSSLAINMPAAGSIYVFGNNLTSGSSYDVVAQPTGGSGVTLVSGGQGIISMTSTGANYAQNTYSSITTSSGITAGGPVTQNSSQYGKLATGDTTSRPGAPTVGMIRYNTSISGVEYWNGTVWILLGQAPTVQRATGGSGNYSPSTGVIRIRVRMCGGGGGGGARTSNSGSTGGTTTFGSWTCIGGTGGGASASAQGGGGSGGATGTGTFINRVAGGAGNAGGISNSATVYSPGGAGGTNPFGGGGNASIGGGSGAVAANSGAGGAGGGANGAANSGSGGGAGEYLEFWVNNPGVTAFAVGAAGAGGAAGGTAGASGAAGIIIIEEFYA